MDVAQVGWVWHRWDGCGTGVFCWPLSSFFYFGYSYVDLGIPICGNGFPRSSEWKQKEMCHLELCG